MSGNCMKTIENSHLDSQPKVTCTAALPSADTTGKVFVLSNSVQVMKHTLVASPSIQRPSLAKIRLCEKQLAILVCF